MSKQTVIGLSVLLLFVVVLVFAFVQSRNQFLHNVAIERDRIESGY